MATRGRLARRHLLGGMAAFAALGATGRVRARQTPAAGDPAESAPFPATIAHAMGETTVPQRPERVVAANDFVDLDFPLSLGVAPVLFGYTDAWDGGMMPWQEAATDLPRFDASGELDLEAIIAADPDLILTMPLAIPDDYGVLSQAAPTIVLDWGAPWRPALRRVGAALGLGERTESRIAETDALIAAAKQDLAPVAGRRLMVGFQYQDAFYVWGDDAAAPEFFRDLGLDFVGGPDPVLTAASLERVDLLADAEILLSLASDPAGIAMQEANPTFRALPAVRDGHYGVLSVAQGRAIGDGLSPLSIPWVLPQVVDMLSRLGEGGGVRLD